MNSTDLTDLSVLLDACQLHTCRVCGEDTLHSIDQVLEQFGPATKLLARCIHCNTEDTVWDIG